MFFLGILSVKLIAFRLMLGENFIDNLDSKSMIAGNWMNVLGIETNKLVCFDHLNAHDIVLNSRLRDGVEN